MCRHKYVHTLLRLPDKIAKKMRMLFNNFKTKHFCAHTEIPAVSWNGPLQPA